MGEASTAHVAHDWRKAIPLLRRVIQIEPNYPHAWNYLADCHEGLGDDEQALQLHIIGAHLIEPDSVVWRALALKSRSVAHDPW